MDACFELMILDDLVIDNLELYQKKIIWEGIEYIQEEKYLWGRLYFSSQKRST